MEKITVEVKPAVDFIGPEEWTGSLQEAAQAAELLATGKGPGNEFLGWVNLPSRLADKETDEIISCAEHLRGKADVVISVGIGGSYLGAKAVYEALRTTLDTKGQGRFPELLFAGQNLSPDYMSWLLDTVRDKEIAVIVISKSGTTTEPAIAFRILKKEMERRYGSEAARDRIVAVTDREKGALKSMADKEGYRSFVIPDDVGGRFSVLTPVGLLPLAAAGIDIRALIDGARGMEELSTVGKDPDQDPAITYARARNLLYRKGFKTEILASYEPQLQYVAEWWKQLYGESEGKDGLGIFPASVSYTADLHSMGQYIQQGERTLFETVLSVGQPRRNIVVEAVDGDPDGLNFLAGKTLSDINAKAEAGVRLAHIDGGVPNIRIALLRIDARNLGGLLYMFERACAISGYMLGVNPFDQPGVEDYKQNMFALLEKPGYEKQTAAIKERITY